MWASEDRNSNVGENIGQVVPKISKKLKSRFYLYKRMWEQCGRDLIWEEIKSTFPFPLEVWNQLIGKPRTDLAKNQNINSISDRAVRSGFANTLPVFNMLSWSMDNHILPSTGVGNFYYSEEKRREKKR